MRFDPSAQERLSALDTRKANRVQSVRRLPSNAEQGDTALFENELYVYDNGAWHDVAQGMRDRFQESLDALTARVVQLEE